MLLVAKPESSDPSGLRGGAGQKVDRVKLQMALEQIGYHLQEVGGC